MLRGQMSPGRERPGGQRGWREGLVAVLTSRGRRSRGKYIKERKRKKKDNFTC